MQWHEVKKKERKKERTEIDVQGSGLGPIVQFTGQKSQALTPVHGQNSNMSPIE
jgi:hypothetical protein